MHQGVATTKCSNTHKYTNLESAVAHVSVCGVENVMSHRGGTVAVAALALILLIHHCKSDHNTV